jgi:hypothetical protein
MDLPRRKRLRRRALSGTGRAWAIVLGLLMLLVLAFLINAR